MRVIILLALVGTALAVPKNANRIVGGSATTVEEYPFMSNMQYLWFGFWWLQSCGGSLITTTVVMSAAHCYEGDSASQWRVLLGTSRASSGGTIHPASQLVLHPGYNRNTLDNDVALVRLLIPATYSDSVQAAAIPSATYALLDDSVVFAVGWGTLQPGGSAPEQLQHVDVLVINQQTCAERYAHLKTQPGFQNWPDITDNMLCAGVLDVGGKDACQGDSGGPLVHNRNVVVGITSWGYSCAHAVYPGVNARVSRYTDWITANA